MFDIIRMVDVLRIFLKKSHFPIFLKITSSTRLNLCMSLILSENDRRAPTESDQSILGRLNGMPAAHFQFECETININFTAYVKASFNIFK